MPWRLALGLFAILMGCSAKTGESQPTTRPGPRVVAWEMRPLPVGQVNLLAMADWGTDTHRQRDVGWTLAEYVEATPVQFHGLLSPGDNIYNHLKGLDDIQWQRVFEDMYDSRVNMPFYCVLGNHDYDWDNDIIQLAYARRNPHSRFKLRAKWYRLDFPEKNPIVTCLMLDSNRHKLGNAEWYEQLQWLKGELARKDRGRWTIVSAHHPLFSNGLHGDVSLLQQQWGPLLRQYKVDFYVSGHDHNLQHLEVRDWPTSFLISGGGGRSRSGMRRDDRGPFARKLYGFVHLTFTPQRAHVRYIDGLTGQAVHEFERWPDGKVNVLSTLGVDKADPNLKAQKPFDERDTGEYAPSMDPEPSKK